MTRDAQCVDAAVGQFASACSGFMSRTADGTRRRTSPRNCAIPRGRCRWRWRSARRLVTALYLVLNVVFIYAAPLEEMKGTMRWARWRPRAYSGRNVAGIFSALMALSLMATVNAMVDHRARACITRWRRTERFLASAAKVHPRWHTPVVGDRGAGSLHHADDADAVSATGDLHRIHAELLRGDERGVADPFPPASRAGSKLRVVSFCYPLFPVVFMLVGTWMTLRESS